MFLCLAQRARNTPLGHRLTVEAWLASDSAETRQTIVTCQHVLMGERLKSEMLACIVRVAQCLTVAQSSGGGGCGCGWGRYIVWGAA